jgi:hypothetical protein
VLYFLIVEAAWHTANTHITGRHCWS